MRSTAKKRERKKNEYVGSSVALVNELDGGSDENRSWFRDFLDGIFSSPDLDYSQYEHLESKRTRQEMKHNGLY
ncbi:MAG: hypothetical protein ABTQ25_12425 [Nitrosomonas ureae]